MQNIRGLGIAKSRSHDPIYVASATLFHDKLLKSYLIDCGFVLTDESKRQESSRKTSIFMCASLGRLNVRMQWKQQANVWY